MKTNILGVTLILILAAGVVYAAKPINNLRNQTVPVKPDGTAYVLEEVQAVIVKGCLARGWQPTVEGPGKITATINVRGKHFAKIEIPFTPTSYSILYVSSNNLDYNAKRQRIHRNYNNWVVKLSGTINKLFRSGPPKVTAPPNNSTNRPANHSSQNDFYGELLKLSELRDKGILTEEEFQEEKRKLLQKD